MHRIGILIAVVTGLGSVASAVAFFRDPVEANFMFTALLGAVCLLCILRLRGGPSQSRNGLEMARHPNVFAPDEPIGKQPIFGPNAKPWLIQFAFLIFCVVFVVPFVKPYLKPHTDAAVQSVFDGICAITGLCTPESAARTRASKDQ